ncbi:MAG: T9SS type A sorting domain-containing protein, partial [Bacteroidota bacterium]
IDPNVDVVVFQEAFDPFPRSQELVPGMEAQGFIYNSGILNDYLPFNGGVIIFSRFPIEATDEYDFLLCGPNSGDCFANKGVMYAKVNKLGKAYHIFGTHMDAGGATEDLVAKNLQFAEMRDFIAAQNIPSGEPALYGGDFNVSPLHGDNLFPNMLDSLDPLIPDYYGFQNSTMGTDTGRIIDNFWVDRRHLLPLELRNEIVTLRGIEDDMWDISDYSDHRTVLARFSFPDLAHSALDTTICTGDNYKLEVTGSGVPLTYQWMHNGLPIFGETNDHYWIAGADSADAGAYACRVQYLTDAGNLTDAVNQLFHPNGPENIVAEAMLGDWNIEVECPVAAVEAVFGRVDIYPNPVKDELRVEVGNLPGKTELEVRDIMGRVMLQKVMRQEQMTVEMGDFPAGTYLLRLKGKKGEMVRRLVVE